MKKKLIIILILLLLIVSVFFIYATIMTYGNQRMPEVEVPVELKKLEKIIESETNGGSAEFTTIEEYRIKKNCNAELSLYIYMNNDSISKSKEILDKYISKVSERVNQTLINKKCIDSLIIDVSSFYTKAKSEDLKSKNYRYTFPIKKQ